MRTASSVWRSLVGLSCLAAALSIVAAWRARERDADGGSPSRPECASKKPPRNVDAETRRLVRAIESGAANGRFADQVEEHASALRSGRARRGSPFVVLVVPGFLYRSLPANGADLASPRQLLSDLAVDVRLVEVGESAPVHRNADRIVEAIEAQSRAGSRMIVVSASKGGPETLEALSRLDRETSKAVAGWINIAGTLNGTLLADRARCGASNLLTTAAHAICRWDLAGVRSLSPTLRRPSTQAAHLPEDLLVVNVIAAPMADEVSRRARGGYRALSAYGPNDGLTLLEDALVPDAITFVQRGTDHFFQADRLGELTYGLLRAIESELSTGTSGPGTERPSRPGGALKDSERRPRPRRRGARRASA